MDNEERAARDFKIIQRLNDKFEAVTKLEITEMFADTGIQVDTVRSLTAILICSHAYSMSYALHEVASFCQSPERENIKAAAFKIKKAIEESVSEIHSSSKENTTPQVH